ncbi:MAG: type II secretion system F family protein [Rhodocyclaceae bacterium]|nr:type II secretion system F family protein [Rhodocyclaceae bacterium]
MLFHVRALDARARIVSLPIEADSRDDALRAASAQGLRALSARPAMRLPTAQRDGSLPIALFSQQLATLLTAGLPLVEAVDGLADKEDSPAARKVFAQLTRSLYEGKSYSQAVEQHPAVFPELYVALMRSAERTGDLPRALLRFVAYRQQTDQVRKKLVSASIYPAVLLLVGGAVLLFLVGYVVPRFSQVYEDMRGHLPLLSQLLLHWGKFMHAHQGSLLAGLAAAVAAITLALRQGGLRARLGLWAESLPGIARHLLVYRLARLYRSLGILLRGGIPVLESIRMARGLVPGALRDRLDAAAEEIRQGVAVSRALDGHGLTTPIALRMLRAGEKSGNLGEMMERSADFHDEEITRWIDWFVKLIEPAMMTVIGGLIGVIVVLMYIPIFELAGSIQ